MTREAEEIALDPIFTHMQSNFQSIQLSQWAKAFAEVRFSSN